MAQWSVGLVSGSSLKSQLWSSLNSHRAVTPSTACPSTEQPAVTASPPDSPQWTGVCVTPLKGAAEPLPVPCSLVLVSFWATLPSSGDPVLHRGLEGPPEACALEAGPQPVAVREVGPHGRKLGHGACPRRSHRDPGPSLLASCL